MDGKIRQGRQRTRWKNEIRSFVGVTWNSQAADRDEWRRLRRPLFSSGLKDANDDNDEHFCKYLVGTILQAFGKTYCEFV